VVVGIAPSRRPTAHRPLDRVASLAEEVAVIVAPVTSLILAEDSFIVREGVKLLLEQVEDFELVALCEDFDGLLAAAEAHRPDVVITDIRMPPTRTDEGIRAALAIRHQYPETGVVVLSQYVEADYALRLFGEGSAGLAYLLKERVGDLEQLTSAIETVKAGRSVIDPRVVDVLVEARTTRRDQKLQRLTEREHEVLGALAQGFSNAGIAEKLYVSERAVEKHINSIFTKLDLVHETETNRRVRAVLVYLAEGGSE
jgi:DNA-binding NarL/FixJ family response regulator